MSPLSEISNDPEQCSVDNLCLKAYRGSLTSILLNEKYSDMTIVCTQSPFFENALYSGAKCQRRMARVVKLPEDDPNILQRFLEFLYTGSYSNSLQRQADETHAAEIQDRLKLPPRCPPAKQTASHVPNQPVRRSHRLNSLAVPGTTGKQGLAELSARPERSTPPEITLALSIYFMADKYHVPSLKLLARDRFYAAAEAHWIKSWQESSWEDTQGFEDVVLDIYISTKPDDTTLWIALCKLIVIKTEQGVMKRRMKQVMKENTELAAGVATYVKEWGDGQEE
ncbi:hypothetical protein F66182_9570 [Fusarium sp. NRRL 66182]|nr:hypothetical protein F66182_9570 [Fusarium sp. NRRL 66182]